MDLYYVRNQLSMGVPLTDIKLRVTDYARVSTDAYEQKKSLRNQVEHFEQYIKENPNWTYVDGYVDDGITGTSDVKRDNFMRMIDDARLGKFDLIVTKEISRFSRNTLDSIKYTRELLSYGVFVLFVNDNINTALPDSELRLTIMASMAQDEIRRLSERVKFGMRRATLRGEILGNDMLYGYKKNKKTGNLCIVHDEAMLVRRLFEFYAIDGLSLSCICKIFNSEGLRTSQGSKWCVSTISRMIENPKYKGFYCAKKTEVIDYMTKKVKYLDKSDWIVYEDRKRIPSIVSSNLWDRANKRLNERRKKFSKKKDNKIIYKNRYLYSAKIYCAIDNCVFHRRIFRRNNRDVTWVCSEYLKNGKEVCNSPNVRESEIDFIIRDLINKLYINFSFIEKLLTNYYVNCKNSFFKDNKLEDMNREIKQLCVKKEKLLELTLMGSISNEEFCSRNKSYNEALKDLQDKVALLNDKDNVDCIRKKDELIKEIGVIIDSKGIFNKIVELLLEKIIVYFDNNRDNICLDVFFNYKTKDKIDELNYEFKRGYDTRGTKRYSVNYLVTCYFVFDF